jgi:ribose/xylose/arabinose/galactoside ABC-type transport system permease subunit
VPSVFFLAAIILFGAILRFTAFGRYAYAIGGNIEAAKLSGIKVVQVQFTAYLLSGLLSDILQLQNIDSNVQLVMKGLIIVGTVLVQEQNLGQLIARWRFRPSPEAGTDPGTAEPHRPPSAARAQFAGEDLDEAS